MLTRAKHTHFTERDYARDVSQAHNSTLQCARRLENNIILLTINLSLITIITKPPSATLRRSSQASCAFFLPFAVLSVETKLNVNIESTVFAVVRV